MELEYKYPNPQRLFVKKRDEWFLKLVEKLNIPISGFMTIRNSQLGQLLLMIQSNRQKMIRAGEEPGPDMFDFSTLSTIVPTYQVFTQLTKLFDEDSDITKNDFHLLKEKIDLAIFKKSLKKLKIKTKDWEDSVMSQERLDELFSLSMQTFQEVVFSSIQTHLEGEDFDQTIDLLKERNQNLNDSILSLFDIQGDISTKSLDNRWIKEEDQFYRIIKIEDEKSIKITQTEFQMKVTSMVSFLLELKRTIEDGSIGIDFGNLAHLLTLEMLIKIPYPEKTFIPLVRSHLSQLKKTQGNQHFYDLLFIFYQIYASGTSQSNPRVFMRMFKSSEKKFREASKNYWQKYQGDDVLLPVLWSSFSSAIVQLGNKISNNPNSSEYEKQCYSWMLRYEQIFWGYGFSKLETLKKNDQISFWSYFVFINSRKVNNAKEALNNFNKLHSLYKEMRIFRTNTAIKKWDIYPIDKYSLLQKVLSYGIESRSENIFKDVLKYNDKLKSLLNYVKDEEIDLGINLQKEFKAVDDIEEFVKNPPTITS